MDVVDPGAEERGTFGLLFGRWSRRLAVATLLVSIAMPPNGLGFSLCVMNRLFGLPCPGCGMTRSLACLSHGRIHDALAFHPFGPVLYAWMLLAIAAALAGPLHRERAARKLEAHERGARLGLVLLVAAFAVFGLVRLGSRIWLLRAGAAG